MPIHSDTIWHSKEGEELRRTTAKRKRMEREMEIAHEMQQSFLPQTLPKVPDVEIAATMRPAREVGGDFYDVIPLSGGRGGGCSSPMCPTRGCQPRSTWLWPAPCCELIPSAPAPNTLAMPWRAHRYGG